MKTHRPRQQRKQEPEEERERSTRQRRRENRKIRRQDREDLRRPPSPWELRGKLAQREVEPEESGFRWWGEFDDVRRSLDEE